MKIKYLGTAAAEGIPALFCECEICKRAREIGGKNIRSRSQLLINDDLLVDYPPDSFYHFNLNHIDLTKIHNLLISHAHEDHFYPLDFAYFLKGFSHPKECLPFTIHGSKDLYNPLKPYIENERNQGLSLNIIEPYQAYKIGKYNITPLRATHGTENPYIYIISDGLKTVFYCHDSGLLKDEVFDFIKNNHIYFDLISIDCTASIMPINYDCHMNVERNVLTVNKLKEIKAADNNTKVVLNHFSHNGAAVIYDELVEAVKDLSFIVSYDGLEIEF